MENLQSAVQLVATVYFSFLFEGLFTRIYGVQLSIEEEVRSIKESIESTMCPFTNHRKDEVLGIPDRVSKKKIRGMRIFASMGFLICFYFLILPGHPLLDAGCGVLVMHGLIFVPLLVCFIRTYTYSSSVRKSATDVADKLKNRIFHLEEYNKMVLAAPKGSLDEVLREIEDKEYVSVFRERYTALESSQKIDVVAQVNEILVKRKINQIIKRSAWRGIL